VHRQLRCFSFSFALLLDFFFNQSRNRTWKATQSAVQFSLSRTLKTIQNLFANSTGFQLTLCVLLILRFLLQLLNFCSALLSCDSSLPVYLSLRISASRFSTGSTFRMKFRIFMLPLLLRKEVIQPHLPIRLPCYDFTPVIGLALDGWLLAVASPALGTPNSHGVTGGVYKARERIHRGMLIRDY
jgi:hypothetical protein